MKVMAEITAKMVNELRQRTNAPMMDTKRALVDSGGDMEKAAELLRERGAASADKKLSNEMKEGLVAGRISNDGKLGVLLRLGCQTDFVARNDAFLKLLGDLTDLVFENGVNDAAGLHALKYPDGTGRTVEQIERDVDRDRFMSSEEAKSYGLLDIVIVQARAINDRPVVIDFIVGADAQVWPMVAAGTSNDEIQAAKGIRPLFDDEGNEGHA